MIFHILIVDDEKNIREGLAAALRMDGYEVQTCGDGETAWRAFQTGDIDLVITDLRMPGLSGEELLNKITSESPGVPVIVLTGHGTVENAVEAMRAGAYDFLAKPLNLERLSLLVKRALRQRELVLKHRQLEEELAKEAPFKTIIGKSPAMRSVYDMISRVAPSKASVLILGESGVGKELVANALHELSPRKNKPLIKVHCAALSPSLLESELFGHEKGAFPGALARKRGRFELANEGTLFLDEIGEINQDLQIKLLRVLQERKFERVGGEGTVEVDVRLVAATNRDLKAEVAKGNFREDLYYRLNVITITVPPLRERKDDIPLLLAAFLKQFSEENGKQIEEIDEKARSRLFAYDWPGNVRELRNCVESAVVMAQSNVITENDLPPTLREVNDKAFMHIPMGVTLDEAERIIIQDTLAANKGNKSKTADILGIGRKTLHRKITEWESAGS
jgi:DNA-binding NtrC family response regulator